MTISTKSAEDVAPARASKLPLLLTVLRIVCGPIVAGLVIWAAQETHRDPALASLLYFAAAAVFILAALTDWLDGYLARKLNAVTPLGAALDHSADKVLVTCALVALAYAALPIGLVVAAIIILARDVAVAGLREGLSASGRSLPVNQIGKWKAAAEMSGVGAYLLFQGAVLIPSMSLGIVEALSWAAALLLWAGAALALISGAIYVGAAAKRAP